MYEVDLLFFFCWWHVILKNRLQYKSTKILHGHQWQVNFFISISIRTDLPNMLSHTVWFDLLIKGELRLKCDFLLISAVVTVKVRDLNFSDVVKPFLYSTWECSCLSSHSNLFRDWRLHSNVITCMLQSVSNYHKQYQKHQIELLI